MNPIASVGLVQINNSFSGQSYLPYSVGVLHSYYKAHFPNPDQYTFHLPLYQRLPVSEAVEHLLEADIVFFSLYVWNEQISLAIGKELKKQNPSITLVYGGSQVPNLSNDFLIKNPFVDLACHGPGEIVFSDILANYPTKNYRDIKNISFIDEKDGYIKNEVHFLTNSEVEALPSPYLDGTFDELMSAHPDQVWLALWETNRGCPYHCSYCDWGNAAVNKVGKFPMERLEKEMGWFANNKIEFIFCCDANFGMLARDLEIVNYLADLKEKTGYPHRLSVQNTKNNEGRSFKIQEVLSETGLNKGAALAMQSIDDNVLDNIGRANIRLDIYDSLQKRFTDQGIQTFTDLILALPGETLDTFIDGVGRVVTGGQHNRIQFNNLSILPNAEMGDPEYQKKYEMIIIENDIINIHGKLEDKEEIVERQELVVGTKSLPPQDWVKVRMFSWMIALIHFNKLLQIPLIVTQQASGVPYRDLFAFFMSEKVQQNSIFSWLLDRLEKKALDIQQGGPEFEYSEKYLGIWWPLDELMMIELAAEGKLNEFYQAAEELLEEFTADKGQALPKGLLKQAMDLNHKLLRLPFAKEDVKVQTDYNIWEVYKEALVGNSTVISKGSYAHLIDATTESWESWDEWSQEVVWYGNKRADYLRKMKVQ